MEALVHAAYIQDRDGGDVDGEPVRAVFIPAEALRRWRLSHAGESRKLSEFIVDFHANDQI